ncbi:MAG: hypothetical protein J6N78_02915 [Clostridia bacterium]|nr:hypothetical protein [Clostridia bacterium]
MEENSTEKTNTTETTNTNTNTTTTTVNNTASTEKKSNWFKAHMAVCIISVVVVIAAVVAIVLLVNNNGGKSPEDVMKTYVEAMQEGNVDKLMGVMDLKGAYAWSKCGRNANKLEEVYKSVSDDDVKKYESTAKSGLESAMKLLKTFGSVQISIAEMEKPEELAKDLYKVKAKVNIKVSVFGVEQEQKQDMSIAVYNGRYIGEAK